MSVNAGNISLSDVMTAVNAALDDAKPFKKQRKSVSPKMDELAAFCQLDPLLARLQKEFRNHKAETAQARAQFGADSPLVEIAADAEDSAWCAMQTRLLELRAERELMRRAQEMILNSERAEERALEKAEAQRVQQLADQMRMIASVSADQKSQKNKEANFLDLLLIYALFFHRKFMEDLVKTPQPYYGFGAAA